MPTDAEIISKIKHWKSQGIGLFCIKDQTGYSLETILRVWDRCGPPVLSQEKINLIREKATSSDKYCRSMRIISANDLEDIAFAVGASVETVEKYLIEFGAHVNGRSYQIPPENPDKPDMRRDPPIKHIDELSQAQRMQLCDAFLNRVPEDKIAKETGIPVSVCKNYRVKLQGAFAALTFLHGKKNVADICETYGIDQKIAEHLLAKIHRESLYNLRSCSASGT